MQLFTHTYNPGRLGNRLYFILQMYIKNSLNPEERHFYKIDAPRQLSNLGLGDFITTEVKGEFSRTRSFCQHFGSDFTKLQARGLVAEHILNSDAFLKACEFDSGLDHSTSIAVHIRNTDYFKHGRRFDCFDRMQYIKDAISQPIYADTTCIYVFSDDIALSKATYDSLLSGRFSKVVYVEQGPAEYDMLKLAVFRNKIILNSTYAVWASIIGSVIHDNSDALVTAPSITRSDDTTPSIYDPAWNILPVKATF